MRFIIVGTGNISRTYYMAAGRVSGVEVAGFVSRRGQRPAYLPADLDVEVATSIGEFSGDFEAVILATPNGLHHRGAIEAAEAGKHVLTEKTLDVSREAMDAMIEACRRHGVRLGVTYQRRMSPDNQAVKKLLEERKLGRIYAADLRAKFYRDQAYYDSGAYRGTYAIDGGGPFMQQAPHNMDIYCWFFGLPAEVRAFADTFDHDIEVEDHGAAVLRHDDGMIGTIVASTVARPGFPPRLEIHAEAGSIVLENDVITTWAIDSVENPSTPPAGAIHTGSTVAVTDTAGHEAIIADFVEAVREGREPAVPGESARMATELALRIYEASRRRL